MGLMTRTLLSVLALGLLAGAVLVSPSQAPVRAQAVPAAPVKTLRIPFDGAGWGMDPHLERTGEAFRFLGLVYEGLYTWVPGPQPQVAPCLAEDFPAISDDKLTYTFKIRAGVKYHANSCFGEAGTRELKAADFVDGFKRLMAKSDGSNGMGWMMARLVVGLDGYAASRRGSRAVIADDEEIEGLKAPDDRTLVMKLTRPCATFVQMLAHGAFCPMPREFIRENRLATRTCGTGPYRLAAYSRDLIYVVEANETYWGEAPGYGRITFAMDASYRSLTGGLRSGKYGEITLYSNWQSDLVSDGKLTGSLQGATAEPVKVHGNGYFFAAFNMEDPLWGALDADGSALRRAVALALNRQHILDAFGQPAEYLGAYPELYPPGMEFGDTDDDLKFGAHDIKEARKVLDGSKYKGGKDPATGKPLVLSALFPDEDRFYQVLAEELKDALQQLGIELDANYTESDYRDMYQDCDEQLYVAAWFLDYPGAHNYLQLFWSGHAGIPDEFQNNSRYRSEEFDKLYTEFEALLPTTANAAKRRELVRKQAEVLARHQPIIPLVISHTHVIRRTDVQFGQVDSTTHMDLRFAKPKE